jgi:hypothetical protein
MKEKHSDLDPPRGSIAVAQIKPLPLAFSGRVRRALRVQLDTRKSAGSLGMFELSCSTGAANRASSMTSEYPAARQVRDLKGETL